MQPSSTSYLRAEPKRSLTTYISTSCASGLGVNRSSLRLWVL